MCFFHRYPSRRWLLVYSLNSLVSGSNLPSDTWTEWDPLGTGGVSFLAWTPLVFLSGIIALFLPWGEIEPSSENTCKWSPLTLTIFISINGSYISVCIYFIDAYLFKSFGSSCMDSFKFRRLRLALRASGDIEDFDFLELFLLPILLFLLLFYN